MHCGLCGHWSKMSLTALTSTGHTSSSPYSNEQSNINLYIRCIHDHVSGLRKVKCPLISKLCRGQHRAQRLTLSSLFYTTRINTIATRMAAMVENRRQIFLEESQIVLISRSVQTRWEEDQ